MGYDDARVRTVERDLVSAFDGRGSTTPYDIHFELQDLMQDNVGIMRTGEDLEKAIAAFPSLWKKHADVRVDGTRTYNPGWHMYWDLRNMLLVAEVVARAALQREESRGAHTRLDFPKTDDGHWVAVNSNAHLVDGRVEVRTMPKPVMPEELKTIVEQKPSGTA